MVELERKERKMLDFDSMPAPAEKVNSPLVSDELVAKVARKMIEWGYQMSNPAGRALTEVLSGHSVMLFGNCGTGKSLFFKALSEYYTDERDRTYNTWFHPYKFSVIRLGKASIRSAMELEHFLKVNVTRQLVVDDLGTEYGSMDFGRRYETMEIILESRDYSNAPTHFISNCNEKQLLERYGDRILDRLHYAESIVFTGESRRRPQGKIDCRSTEWFRIFGVWESPDKKAD